LAATAAGAFAFDFFVVFGLGTFGDFPVAVFLEAFGFDGDFLGPADFLTDTFVDFALGLAGDLTFFGLAAFDLGLPAVAVAVAADFLTPPAFLAGFFGSSFLDSGGFLW